MSGRKIGRYEILSELDQGGMAVVYLAHDPVYDRQVAVKVLTPLFTRDPQFRARFEREAALITALEHPCIVPVYEYGQAEGQLYIVMRFLSGGTLEDWIAGQAMLLDEIAAITQRVAEALDAAHSQHIIHRDLKPSNVMFDSSGLAFLSDFGIAKLLEASAATLTGKSLIGTPAYMSPEQAVGDKQIDKRSDIYSLGILLYEMLTGRQPYQAKTMGRLMLMHVTEPVPTLDAGPLGLSPAWNAILARALAKKPDDRYQTAGELAEDVSVLCARESFSAARSQPAAARPASASASPASTVRFTRDELDIDRLLSGESPAAAARPASALPHASTTPSGSAATGGKINLNQASAAEIETLPGIGPVLARRIVDHCRTHGPFAHVEALVAVKGIGPALLEKLRPLITVQ